MNAKTCSDWVQIAVILVTAVPVASHSSPGQKPSYSQEVERQERCKTDGELAEAFYGASAKDVRSAYEDVARKVKAKELSKQKAEAFRFLLYQGASAPSAKEAYMRGWAACMDGKYDFK